MANSFSRRVFVTTALALGLPGLVLAAPPTVSLRPVARGAANPAVNPAARPATNAGAIVQQARLSGRTGAAVAHAGTGQMLDGVDADTALPPASVLKAITALYALDALGAAHRFDTRLVATGPVSGDTLQGDLILAGGGDPTLDTDGLADLARRLAATGVKRITGRFLVWGGALPYQRQIVTDQPDHVGYNPAISGLALNYNRVHFEWRRDGQGWGVAMDARSDSLRPAVRMARVAIVNRAVPVYTYADRDGIETWTVANAALGKGGSRWLPVRRPDLYAAEVFRVLARDRGVTLPVEARSTAVPQGNVLASRPSEPLPVILRDMLRFSTNLTAEMVGLAATRARTGRMPDDIAASARAMAQWANGALGLSGHGFADHSGLSDASRLTPAGMVRALATPAAQAALPGLLRAVVMRDAKGQPVKAHPLQAVAKTGTLNFASSLAGYVTTPGGTRLAFAVFSIDPDARARISIADRERPAGAAPWNGRAKGLQQALIDHWGSAHG